MLINNYHQIFILYKKKNLNSLSKSISLGESSLDSDPLRESRRSSLDSQASVIQSAITEVEFQSENVINLIINIDCHVPSLFIV